jgi:hydroxyacylglutathione hydrolase
MSDAGTNSLQNHLSAGLENANVASLLPDVGTTPGYQVISMKLGSPRIINYSYLIFDHFSGQAAIVDPAWELETVLCRLREAGAKLSTILLTHSHFDHVDLVKPLLQRFDARVVISRREMEFYNFCCPNLYPVDHGDKIQVGQTAISCLLTSGHTAGGMCFLLRDSLFTGDTIFIEGCGICTAPGGSPSEMFKSIQMIKKTVEPHVSVFPGHSFGKTPGCRLDSLLKENLYFQINRENWFVDFRMRKGQKNFFDFK